MNIKKKKKSTKYIVIYIDLKALSFVWDFIATVSFLYYMIQAFFLRST
jgi:hypothetical protein